MFELPAIYKHDFEIYGTNSKVLAFFRALEAEEVRKISAMQSSGLEYRPKYVENLLVPRDGPRAEKYVGLVTNGVYDQTGQLISDMFSDVHGKPFPKKFIDLENKCKIEVHSMENAHQRSEVVDTSNSEPHSFDIVTSKKFRDLVFPHNGKNAAEVGREIVAMNNGLEILPRSTVKPRVWIDSPKIQQMVHEAHSSNNCNLSSKALKILMRSNYRVPFGLTYNYDDDRWMRLHMRRRSLQVIVNIFNLCLERRDYERAWTALCCMIRSKNVEPRLLWMPALELLAWRHSIDHRTKTPEEYLDWLIERNPKMPHSRQRMHRKLPLSVDFMPTSLLMRLAKGEYEETVKLAEKAVNSRQFANDPFCWALCGLARLKMKKHQSGLRIQKDFARCLELGGVLPSRIRRLALNLDQSDDGLLDVLSSGMGDQVLIDNAVNIVHHDSEYDNDCDNDNNDNDDDINDNDSYGSDSNDDNDMRIGDTKSSISSSDNYASDLNSSSSHEEISGPDEGSNKKPLFESQAKRLKVDANQAISDEHDDVSLSSDRHVETFYSQSTTLGGELGSSSDDDSY